MLDNDITRCRGEGNAGAVCARRLECARFRTIDEDAASHTPQPHRSYSAMLCRPPNYPFLWPAHEK